MKKIILKDRSFIDLSEWQKQKRLPEDRVSKHILLNEVIDSSNNELILSEIIIKFFEEVRSRWGRAIKIISGYRSPEKQRQLVENYKGTPFEGLAASGDSTHNEGCAIDMDTVSQRETRDLIGICRIVRDTIEPFECIRLGWKKYLEAGMTSIHADCAPFYFGKNSHDPNCVVRESWKIFGLEW